MQLSAISWSRRCLCLWGDVVVDATRRAAHAHKIGLWPATSHQQQQQQQQQLNDTILGTQPEPISRHVVGWYRGTFLLTHGVDGFTRLN
jgi:hypothetical protein